MTQKREQKGSSNSFLRHSLKCHRLYVCHILPLMNESISPLHMQGRKIISTFKRKKYHNVCILKPPQYFFIEFACNVNSVLVTN